MSAKRKQSISGYVPSSDDEEDDSPAPAPSTAKKARVVPTAASSGLTAPAFNRPKAAGSRTASVPPRPTLSTPATTKSTQQLGQKGPVAEVRRTALLTPRTTPNPPTRASDAAETHPNPRPTGLELSSDESDTTPLASPVETRRKEKTRAPEPVPGPSQPATRHPISFEVAALSNEVAECMRKDDYEKVIWGLEEELELCKKGLGDLTTRFESFVAQHDAALAAMHQSQLAAPNTSSTTVPPAPTAEQVETPGLAWNPRVDLESYVPVSDTQTIRGLLVTYVARGKSARAFEPSSVIKKHIRVSFYKCLEDVSQASTIKAPFFDTLGKHVMFPPELADPTGHIYAYPNWSGSLESNAEFFARVILQVRSTFPGASEASIQIRTLTEKVLIECLVTGPWNTCVSEWRKIASGRTALNADQIRQNVRRRKRVENMGLELAEARKEIPELADKRYDGLFHTAMLPAEESEGEGENAIIYIKKPSNQSKFVDTIYRCVKRRIKRRHSSMPGNSYKPRKRKTRIIKMDDIPDLKRNGDLTMIPAFAFSKKWRRANKKLLNDNSHRVDLSLVDPPNLDAFFAKYPASPSDDEEEEEEEAPSKSLLPCQNVHEEKQDVGYDGGDDDAHEEDLNGNGSYGGNGEGKGKGKGGGEGEGGGEGNGTEDKEEQGSGPNDRSRFTPKDIDMDTIDPRLRPDAPKDSSKPQPKAAPQPTPDNAPTSTLSIKIPPFKIPFQDLPRPHPDHGKVPAISDSEVDETLATATQVTNGGGPGVGGSAQGQAKGGAGKGEKKAKGAGGNAQGGQEASVGSQAEPAPKPRRGRPPKNSKK